jgi:hypothetical protein
MAAVRRTRESGPPAPPKQLGLKVPGILGGEQGRKLLHDRLLLGRQRGGKRHQ